MVVVVDIGLSGENVTVVAHDGVLLSLMKVTSASQAAASSSELMLYASSTKGVAEICDSKESESWDLGTGMRGVKALDGAVGKTGTGVSCILAG